METTILAGEALAQMRALPWASGPDIAGKATVMILAPHADDETIGCGGLIQALAQAALPIELVFVTDGTGAHPNSVLHSADARRSMREREAVNAAAILGVAADRLTFLRTPDTAAPREGAAFADIVQRITAIAVARGVGSIFAPWRHDPHCDHLAAHLMAEAVAARLGIRHLAYPVWGWTLPPDTPVGPAALSGHRLALDERQQATRHRALQAHASQLGRVITDDPGGFALGDATLSVMLQPFEVFLTTP